jgi:phosphosulfolactate synthase (CoM biosynthesis protein A)
MDKIQKMIETYNNKANKWGFDEIEVNNGSLNTEFKEKTTIGYSFFGRIKVLYQNGYMKEEYEKIKNSLPQVTKEMVLSFEKPSFVYEKHKHEMTIEEEALANTFKG